MRRIRIVKNRKENSIFSIAQDIAFEYCQEADGQMIRYQVELELRNQNIIDIRLLLLDMESELKFYFETPAELTDYIKQYDEYQNPEDESLFHDLRTRYMDIVRQNVDGECGIQDEILILGYTVLSDRVYLVIKGFSFNAVCEFYKKLATYCNKEDIEFLTRKDIRMAALERYMLAEKSKKGVRYQQFLEQTLNKDYFGVFRNIFRQIDRDGYFSQNFLKDEMARGKEKTKHLSEKKISRYFATYWKQKIELSNKVKEVLCLHDEMPEEGKIENYVYSFKPGLLQYYMQEWFEDFTLKTLERINHKGYQKVAVLPGREYNFYEDGNGQHVRELDGVLVIRRGSELKMLAIECKKTLSHKEVQETNKKNRERILDSGKNVFDAFVYIGCFSEDMKYDIKIDGMDACYKRGIINGKDGDVPYYAFYISSIGNFENIMEHIVCDVFENW